jgi:hypothetical protein
MEGSVLSFLKALRDKGKEWLVLENASEWIDMSTLGLLFHWDSAENPTECVGLVQSGHHPIVFMMELNNSWVDAKKESLTPLTW